MLHCNNVFENSGHHTLLLQMSQKDDSESDIWEYKPLKKKKKPPEPSLSCSGPVAKRRCASKNSVKTDTSTPAKQAGGGRDVTCRKAVQTNDLNNAFVNVSAQCKEEHSRPGTQTLSSQPTHSDEVFTTDDAEEERPSSGDFCPICQMPFSILLVQSQRWHVAECLDTSRDESKGMCLVADSIFGYPSYCFPLKLCYSKLIKWKYIGLPKMYSIEFSYTLCDALHNGNDSGNRT